MKNLSEYIIERTDTNWRNWKEDGYDISMLSFKEKSEEYGIEGGKISKLQIRKHKGEVLCNYDRGWDIEPKDEVKELYDKIIKKYN